MRIDLGFKLLARSQRVASDKFMNLIVFWEAPAPALSHVPDVPIDHGDNIHVCSAQGLCCTQSRSRSRGRPSLHPGERRESAALLHRCSGRIRALA